ncbi:MAG TPA: hypothetical protein VGL45_09960 [Bradyrhizobium sp.]
MAADIAGFRGKLNEAVKATNEAVETIKKGFELIGVGLSVDALVEFTKSQIELGDQLSKGAIKAGISAGAFSELAFAAKGSGVGLDELSASLAKMQKAISTAGSGVGTAKATFDALGLTFAQIKALTPDQQFEVFAQRINDLKVPADKTRAAIELFGRAGADMLPLFSQGAEGIAKARLEAGLLGASFSDDTIERLHQTQESLDHVTSSLKGLGTAVVVDVAPSISLLADRLTAFLSGDELKTVTAQIALVQTQLKEQHSGFFGPAAGSVTDKDLLTLQTKLATLKLIEQTAIDVKNQNINGLLDSLSPPPGFSPDIKPIAINPNLKIHEDSLKKFYDDLDAITQTGGEKLIADTALLQARLDVLVKDGIISQADAFNRERGPADTKALSEFFTGNKAVVDQSIKESQDSFKTYYASMAEDSRAAAANAKRSFDETAQFADNTGRAIQNSFAQAFENIGQGGLRGLVSDFAKAFQQIFAQAAAFDLFKALGLDKIFANQGGGSAVGGIFGALGSLFGGGDSTAVTFNSDPALLGFAGGGSFPVGGTGGTDSQLVQFKASPNERVTVSTPGQGAAPGIIFSPVYNIGSGVSRSDVISACQTTQKTTIAHMTKLIKGGAFA